MSLTQIIFPAMVVFQFQCNNKDTQQRLPPQKWLATRHLAIHSKVLPSGLPMQCILPQYNHLQSELIRFPKSNLYTHFSGLGKHLSQKHSIKCVWGGYIYTVIYFCILKVVLIFINRRDVYSYLLIYTLSKNVVMKTKLTIIYIYIYIYIYFTLNSIHTVYCTYVTMDYKTKFFEIEIYTSSENWINKCSIDVWFVRQDNIWLKNNYLKIWNLRVQKI